MWKGNRYLTSGWSVANGSAWLLGLWELLFVFVCCVWLCFWPPFFRCYYPIIASGLHEHDAVAIVEWLSGRQPEEALLSAMDGGDFDSKAVVHFADVREWVSRLPWVIVFMVGIGLALAQVLRPPRRVWLQAQIRAALWLGCGCFVEGAMVAIWGWEPVFSSLHRPLFRSGSYSFSPGSFIIEIFPAQFWISVLISLFATLIMMMLLLGMALKFAFTKQVTHSLDSGPE